MLSLSAITWTWTSSLQGLSCSGNGVCMSREKTGYSYCLYMSWCLSEYLSYLIRLSPKLNTACMLIGYSKNLTIKRLFMSMHSIIQMERLHLHKSSTQNRFERNWGAFILTKWQLSACLWGRAEEGADPPDGSRVMRQPSVGDRNMRAFGWWRDLAYNWTSKSKTAAFICVFMWEGWF